MQNMYPTETGPRHLLIHSILKIRHKMHCSEKTQTTIVHMAHGKLPVCAEVPTPQSVKNQMVFSAWYVLSVLPKTTRLGH
jgi:hypothetical protein